VQLYKPLTYIVYHTILVNIIKHNFPEITSKQERVHLVSDLPCSEPGAVFVTSCDQDVQEV